MAILRRRDLDTTELKRQMAADLDAEFADAYSKGKKTAYAQAGLPGPHFKGVFVDKRNKLVVMSLLPGFGINYVSTTKVMRDDQE